MKILLLFVSLLIFAFVQIGAVPAVYAVLPVLPLINTIYLYFLMLLPFLWLLPDRRVRLLWKVATLTIPVILGMAVPLVGQLLGEVAVVAQFGTQQTVRYPTPSSVEVIVPEHRQGRELTCDRICQVLLTSREIGSVRLTTRDARGSTQATEVALAASGQCVPLSDHDEADPSMLEQQARGFCPVLLKTTSDAADLSLASEAESFEPNESWFVSELLPSPLVVTMVSSLVATPRDGAPVSWTQVNYSVPSAPLTLKLMTCEVFFCPGPSAWDRDERTLNSFDQLSLVRHLLSLKAAPQRMSMEQLALLVVSSPRTEFTPEQIEILKVWAAPGKRGTKQLALTPKDAEIVAKLSSDPRLDGPLTLSIQAVLRAYPELVDLHFDALLQSARRGHSEGRSSLGDAMLVAGQEVLETNGAKIEAYLASLGPGLSVPMLGLAGRLGRDLTDEVAAAIADDKLRAATLLACLSGPPMSADLTNMVLSVISQGTGNDARYALQVLAIRGQLAVGTEAAVAAGKYTREWINLSQYERYEGDARMCAKPPL